MYQPHAYEEPTNEGAPVPATKTHRPALPSASSKGLTRIAIAGFLFELALSSLAIGEEGVTNFVDDFADGSATDGDPGSWEITPHIDPSSYAVDASDGDLTFTTMKTGTDLSFYLSGSHLEDTSIRSQVRLEGEAESVWLWAQFPLNFHWVIGWLEPNGELGLSARSQSFPTIESIVPESDFRVDQEDVVLQLDIIGRQASLFAWRPGEPMPTTPQVTLTVSTTQPGSAGGGMSDSAEGASVTYRYIQISSRPIRDGNLGGEGDADGDKMLDAWETMHGLDPTVDDADLDLDGDGVRNLDELALKTDPSLADTDDDGLSDGVETGTGIWTSVEDTGTDPLISDTDGDLLLDGVENPTLDYDSARPDIQPGTDPNVFDSDGDGASDGPELANGTDPTDASSYPESPVKGNGAFTVRHVWLNNTGEINNLADAERALQGDTEGSQSITVESRAIHYHEESAVFFFGDRSGPYPLWSEAAEGIEANHDHFVIEATGKFYLKNAGLTSFMCNSDDGFELRIDGKSIGQAGNRGRQSTVMEVDLERGLHDIQLIHWERSGDAGVTLMIYRGTGRAVSPNETDWELLELYGSAPFQINRIETIRERPDNLRLQWDSQDNDLFTVEHSSDLKEWHRLVRDYPSHGDQTTLEIAIPQPDPKALFFRAVRTN